jgi:hypothetical protein
MKATLNLNNKKSLNIKDKSLLDKLEAIFSGTYPEFPEAAAFENILTYYSGLQNSIAGTENNIHNSGSEITLNNARTIADKDKEKNNNPEETGSPGILRYIIAGREISTAINSRRDISAVKENSQQGDTNGAMANSLAGTEYAASGGGNETAFKRSNEFDSLINNMDKKVISFTASAGNSFKKMWDDLVSDGRKAKDPWDAVWLSLRDSALKRIGEILKTDLFDDLFSQVTGGGSSKGFFSSIISGIAGIFTGGGVLAKTGSASFASGKISAAAGFNNYPADRELINSFTKYAEAAEKWQREIRVVNDLFENNRGIKTVQEYLSKIKS